MKSERNKNNRAGRYSGRKRKKMKYYTADKETGTFIDEFDTLEEAEKAVEEYEESDRKEGIYQTDFYAIVDAEHCSVGESDVK